MTNKEAIEQFKERLAITDYRKQVPEYYEAIEMAIAALERCNVVEQYRWERDIALEQLKEIGCGFGQNMDDVKKALEKADKYRCSECGFTTGFTDGHTAQYKYCPQCGRRISWEGIE